MNYKEISKINRNTDRLCSFIKSMGGEQFAQSCGSSYFNYNGQTVRISNHASGGYSSLIHEDTDINIVVRSCDEMFFYLKKYFNF